MQYKIEETRKQKGMTQQELADKAGCTRQFINMLENSDEINVSSKLLLRIAQALDCTVDSLFFKD